MSPCLPAILCARVVLCPDMPLAARGFQLQNTGMPFALVSEKAKSRLTPLRASPDSHSRLHMADQPKGTVSSFNPFKDQFCLKTSSAMAWKILGWASWELKGFDLPAPKKGVLASCCLPETGGHVGHSSWNEGLH